MMATQQAGQTNAVVDLFHPAGRAEIVLVCEHASAFIPPALKDLGLARKDRQSHAVWDPGALAVARRMAQQLDAVIVAGGVSRLVYDCNRPPGAPDAIPTQSERITVPGNTDLTAAARSERARKYYAPFRTAVAKAIARRKAPALITVHSFTPIYHGTPRRVEIGVLHDTDARLADAMLDHVPSEIGMVVERNAPYGPDDGVTHTLKEHGVKTGLLNVMIEIRNDLVASQDQQDTIAQALSDWIETALTHVRRRQDA